MVDSLWRGHLDGHRLAGCGSIAAVFFQERMKPSASRRAIAPGGGSTSQQPSLLAVLTPRAHGASAAHHNKKDRGLGLQKALLEAINFGKYRAEQDLGIFLQFPEIEQTLPDISRNYFGPRRHTWKT